MAKYRTPPGKVMQCLRCGKYVKTRIPKDGDGTAVRPVWHKNYAGKPCDGRFDVLDYFGRLA